MRVRELDFELPPELIAQRPIEPRDASRMLVLHRETGQIEHRLFRDIVEYVRAGDCLVLNNTRVIPARFVVRRDSGGRIEALFLHAEERGWCVLLKGGGRLREGEPVRAANDDLRLVAVERRERGHWLLRPEGAIDPLAWLGRCGQTPLPPYIERAAGPDEADASRYQTVFASQAGAVAAPTAGLHFTRDLLDDVRGRGVRLAEVTLHVGYGTFAPIEVDDLREHVMHAEWFEVGEGARAALREARASGARVWAVGTTAARVLETIAREPERVRGWTRLLLAPPDSVTGFSAMLTNFHLPRSTLLALVMAVGGVDAVRAAYADAVLKRYKFFSYGDCMLLI